MMTSSANSKYGDVLISSGVDPRGGGEVLLDACDVGVGDDFELFVKRCGAGGVRCGLIDE